MSGDLIRRQDAIKAVKVGALSSAMIFGRTDAGHTALIETLNAINCLPSAEREKGSWINEPYEKGLYVHRCSNCLKASGIGGGDLWFNFCPNCGADMRGEEE